MFAHDSCKRMLILHPPIIEHCKTNEVGCCINVSSGNQSMYIPSSLVIFSVLTSLYKIYNIHKDCYNRRQETEKFVVVRLIL